MNLRYIVLSQYNNSPGTKTTSVTAILDEDEYENFCETRDMSCYKVIAVNLDHKDINKYGDLESKLDNADCEIIFGSYGGYCLTFNEVELMEQIFDTEIRCSEHNVDMLENVIFKYMKFSKEEEEIINKMIKVMRKVPKEYVDYCDEDEDYHSENADWMVNYENIIKLTKVIPLKGDKNEK